MSYCNKTDNKKLSFGIGCYRHGRATDVCSAKFISSCNCRSNAGCLDRSDCGGLRSTGSAASCSGPCQCAEEEIWNSNAPPRPNCRWLSNFVELRRQWSNHSRQQACCSCKRSCRTLAPCRSCPPPPTPLCSGAILAASDCQKCCRRLSGGASTSKMAPVDKSASPNRPLKREAGGGGCSLSCCNHPSTRCNSPNMDCSSTASSSCCPSQCSRYSTPSSSKYQSCVSPLKSILKKRNCCRSNTSHCLCQPMPRDCNCPPPIQVDARAIRECTCERPSSPECACPPSERRFPKTTVKCPNARLCCSFPKQPSGSKCCCARCQPCSSPSCEPCTSAKCRTPVQPKISCRPCSPQSSCSPCRPSTPCRKLTTCSRPSSSCRTGQCWREIAGNAESIVRCERGDAERLEKYLASSCDCRCTADCAEVEKEHSGANCDAILDEESVQNSTSMTSINSREAVDPAMPVDPEKKGESVPRNTVGGS